MNARPDSDIAMSQFAVRDGYELVEYDFAAYEWRKVGQVCDPTHANQMGYTDVKPFEIVRIVSDKTVEIREMACERDPSWKMDVHPGGFCAHVSNQQDQKWFITSDEAAPVRRIRKQKTGLWKDSNGNRFFLDTKPVKFHDYNF